MKTVTDCRWNVKKRKKIIMIGDEKVNNKLNEDLSTQFSNLTNSVLFLEHLKVLVMLYIIPMPSKILFLEDGTKVLRFEDFKSPNKLDLEGLSCY